MQADPRTASCKGANERTAKLRNHGCSSFFAGPPSQSGYTALFPWDPWYRVAFLPCAVVSWLRASHSLVAHGSCFSASFAWPVQLLARRGTGFHRELEKEDWRQPHPAGDNSSHSILTRAILTRLIVFARGRALLRRIMVDRHEH